MMSLPPLRRAAHTAAAAIALTVLLAGCTSADDGATVTTIGTEEGGSASASGSSSGSASASAPSSGSASAPSGESGATSTAADGGYAYASDVSAHRLVLQDVCDVKALLDEDPIDFDAVATVYREGGASVNSDGSVRTLAGFATATDRLHGFDAYHGTPTPLDDLVSDALAGEGIAEGESDAVRAQLVEKGIQNLVMVAWVLHELEAAIGKVEEGDIDPATGAAHNWDEGWAFYHGAAPDCAPWATAVSRAENFGTLAEDGTAPANALVLDAMRAGRDAAIDGDVGAITQAAADIRRGLAITYSQAAIRYAQQAADELAAGDETDARVQQAEGLAFWGVIEPIMADAGADTDTVDAILSLENPPGGGGGDDIRAALQPAWDTLGITAEDIGTLQ